MIQNNYFEKIGFIYGVPKAVVKSVIDKIVIGKIKYPANYHSEYILAGVAMNLDNGVSIQYKIGEKYCSVIYTPNELKLSSAEGDARYLTIESADFICGKISELTALRSNIIDVPANECMFQDVDYFNGDTVSKELMLELLDRPSEITVVKPTYNKVRVEERKYTYLITRETKEGTETYTYERDTNFRRVDLDSDKTEFSKEVMSDMFYAMRNYYYGKVTI